MNESDTGIQSKEAQRERDSSEADGPGEGGEQVRQARWIRVQRYQRGGHRDHDGEVVPALPPEQLSLGDVLAEVLTDTAAHDVAEPGMILVDAERQVVTPLRRPSRRCWPHMRGRP